MEESENIATPQTSLHLKDEALERPLRYSDYCYHCYLLMVDSSLHSVYATEGGQSLSMREQHSVLPALGEETSASDVAIADVVASVAAVVVVVAAADSGYWSYELVHGNSHSSTAVHAESDVAASAELDSLVAAANATVGAAAHGTQLMAISHMPVSTTVIERPCPIFGPQTQQPSGLPHLHSSSPNKRGIQQRNHTTTSTHSRSRTSLLTTTTATAWSLSLPARWMSRRKVKRTTSVHALFDCGFGAGGFGRLAQLAHPLAATGP
jgi:hypothetical protein